MRSVSIVGAGLTKFGEHWNESFRDLIGKAGLMALESAKIEGKEIQAGKYGFFTIPGTETWTVIINKNWQQHLTDEYDEKDDLIRLQVVPEKIETNQERLMYRVDQTGEGKFNLIFYWEKIKIKIPFELN